MMGYSIVSLILRPDPLRYALYRLYERLPRPVAIPPEIWSNDLTYGRLIDQAEIEGNEVFWPTM